MEEFDSNKNNIARWINNDLSEEETLSFEQTEEFKQYEKILSKSAALTPPPFDKEQMKSAIFDKIDLDDDANDSGVNTIARWINGDLSEEERLSVEQTEEFKQYEKILSKSAALTPPSFDKEQMKSAIFDKIDWDDEANDSGGNTIARWINNDLSEEELLSFEQTEEFKQYEKILSKSAALTPPSFDKEQMKSAIFDKIDWGDAIDSDGNTIARWINSDLSEEERLSFEQTEDFKKYEKILSKSETLIPPPFDKEQMKSTIFDKLSKTEKSKKQKPVIRLSYWIGLAAAACVAIGFFLFKNPGTTYQTGFGEQLTISLPDGSEVRLNAKSKLNYNEKTWADNRTVSLKGEAFFSVQKGSDFLVKTKSGTVAVLGTKFNVHTQKKFLEVVCHEGKVRVNPSKGTSNILTRGKAYRSIDGEEEYWELKEATPSWLIGETTCYKLPLEDVLKKLESQFDIVFETKGIDLNQRYTGSYTHKDLGLALRTIFVPMEITYRVKKANQIILTQNNE